MRRTRRAHPVLNNRRGVALLLTLSLIVIIATFAAAITSKARAALVQANNYKSSAQAFALAESGLHRALYELKFDPASGHAACAGTAINAQDMKYETWYYGTPTDPLRTSTHASFFRQYMVTTVQPPNVSEELSRRHRIRLKIVDSASRININAPDTVGLARLLTNLFSICDTSIASSVAQTIIANRPAITRDATTGKLSGGYAALYAIKRYFSDTQYAAVKPYLTARSFVDVKLIKETDETISHEINRCVVVDPATEARAPVNINTAPVPVLRAVLRGLAGMTNTTADTLADRIAARTNDATPNSTTAGPFETWSEFDRFLDAQTGLSFDKDVLFAMLNPNRPKGGASAEPYTTDFCFSSEGYFEIESLGDVINAAGATYGVRSLSMKTKIFDVFRLSTKDDFVGSFTNERITNPDLDGNGIVNIIDPNLFAGDPAYNATNPYKSLYYRIGDILRPGVLNITWFDSTPVDYTDEAGHDYPARYATIPGSLKLGFWDNFDEEVSTSRVMWWIKNREQSTFLNTSFIYQLNSSPHFTYGLARDDDNEIWQDYYIDEPSDDENLFYGNQAPYCQIDADDESIFSVSSYNDFRVNSSAIWIGSMYARATVTEGPRAIDQTIGNIPGDDGDDPAGRDYRDVGAFCFRFNENAYWTIKGCYFGLSTTGNYYNYEQLFNPYDMNGDGVVPWLDSVAIHSLVGLPGTPTPPNSYVDASSAPFTFADRPQASGYPLAPNNRTQVNSFFGITPGPWDMDNLWMTPDGYFLSNPFANASLTPQQLRDKTYRVVLKNSNATMQVANPNIGSDFSTLYTAQLPSSLDRGIFMLTGKGDHPAWDDVHIVGSNGEYTTAGFTPGTFTSTNASLLWGTCAWTETLQNTGASSNPQAEITLVFPTGTSLIPNEPYGLYLPYTNHGEGGPLRTGNTIAQYPYHYFRVHVNMSCDIAGMSGNRLPDIPIFEDATVTYLKETETYDITAT